MLLAIVLALTGIGAPFLSDAVTHRSASNSVAVTLSPASLHSILRITALASADTPVHTGLAYSCCKVTCMRSRAEYASEEASKR